MKTHFTCHGQFPGTASTPPMTRVMGETPQLEGPGGTNNVRRQHFTILVYLSIYSTDRVCLKVNKPLQ